MKILLTGGAGYIGTHTIIALAQAGHEVVVADNYTNSQPEAISRVERIIGKKVPVYQVDVCDKEALRKIFAENALDGVIHFAGLKAVGESVSIPLAYYRNNLDSTLSLCEVMAEFGVNSLVFSSSATVYGLIRTMPLTEDMEGTGATNPYGWTKWMNEQILTDVAAANPSLSVILLRYFNPIGAHESGMIGEEPKGIPNNIMPYITKVAVGALERVSVYGNDYDTPDGTGVRDYIHVMDLARGHVAACTYAASHKGMEIVNLGTGIGYSVLELIHTFSRVNEVEVPYVITARRPGDIATCYADASKAKRLFQWEARHGLEDMCRDSWRWQKQNPNGYEGHSQA